MTWSLPSPLRLSASMTPERLALLVGLAAGSIFAVFALQTSPLTGMLLLLGIAVATSLFIWPYAGFLVTAAMAPLERFGRFTNDDTSFTFSVMRIAGLLSVGAFLFRWLMLKRKMRTPVPFIWYVAYMTLGVLSLSWTSDMHYGFNQTSMQLGNLMFFFVVLNIVETLKKARIALAIWVAVTVVIGVWTIYQWYQPNEEGLVQADDYYNSGAALTTSDRFAAVTYDVPTKYIERQKRAIGTTSHPGAYGLNLILTMPFFFYFMRTVRSRWLQIAVGAGALITAYNVLLTNTRAALFALAVQLVICLFTRLIRLQTWHVVAIAVLGVAAFSFAPTDLKHRVFRFDNWFSESTDSSFGDRLYLMRVSVDIISENPLFGIGLGNQVEVPKRAHLDWRDRARSAHNDFIATLLEVGLVGFICVFCFLLTLYRRYRFGENFGSATRNPQVSLLMNAARVQFFTLLFFGLQAEPLTLPIKGFWLVAGIGLALTESLREHALQIPSVTGEISPGALVYGH